MRRVLARVLLVLGDVFDWLEVVLLRVADWLQWAANVLKGGRARG